MDASDTGLALEPLDCTQLAAAASGFLNMASACSQQLNDPCRLVAGADMCGCAIAVVDPDSTASKQFHAVVAEQKKKGCTSKCAGMTCPPAGKASCQKPAQQDNANCQVGAS